MLRIVSILFMFSLNCAVLAEENPTGTDSKVPAGAKHSLIEIYCGALVMEPLEFSTQASLDAVWEGLGQSLEEGKLYSTLSNLEQAEAEFERLKDSDSYQSCVSEHAKDVELGEFILQGRQILKQSAANFKEVSEPILLSAAFAIEDREVNAGSFEFNIQDAIESASFQNPSPASEIELKALAERQERYHQLWQNFLNQLKQNTQIPLNTF